MVHTTLARLSEFLDFGTNLDRCQHSQSDHARRDGVVPQGFRAGGGAQQNGQGEEEELKECGPGNERAIKNKS